MEVSPKVHLISGVIANVYLVIDADGLTLIDAGLPGSEKKILNYVQERGYAPKDLRRIVVTHADTDHVGGLGALKHLSGARVYASAIEAAAVSHGRSSRQAQPAQLARRLLLMLSRGLFRPRPVEVDQIVAEGETLPILGGLQVIETPGHSPGHISLFSPSTGILFTGDSIIARAGRLTGSVPACTWDADKAAASVRRQAALSARVVCPGHGMVVTDAAVQLASL